MKVFALSGLLLLQFNANSQLVSSSVTNSSGGHYSQSAYSFDWSVGELAIVEPMKAEGSLLVLTNGFLQPNLPAIIPVQHFSEEELKITPNPTYSKIDIKFATIHRGWLMMSVYDSRGKLLYTGKKRCNGVPDMERIDLSGFTAGTYLVRIELDPEKGSQPKSGSYKIVKL